MTTKTYAGLENLKSERELQYSIKGNIGYLCHGASVDSQYQHGILILQNLFGNRLKKLFSPQHGIFGDAQDDMIESDHLFHDGYQLPVYSLYSETRKPTPEMLSGLDHLIVDIQDVGTRVYTYIYTLALVMEACGENHVEVVVLDRPNPINGIDIEGNILDTNFASFVGMYPIPMRHGLTFGEFALMAQKFWNVKCQLNIIPMQGWKREMSFEDTLLPWVFPSPNLPNLETALVYPGSVLFEGTNISEGRGTAKSLEIIGHPMLNPNELVKQLSNVFLESNLRGFILRPTYFRPTFHKHMNVTCGGFQVHITNRDEFRPWRLGQVLCRELFQYLGNDFQWKQPPFEYEFERMPIDVLNGTDRIRHWVEVRGNSEELEMIEAEGRNEYLDNRRQILLY